MPADGQTEAEDAPTPDEQAEIRRAETQAREDRMSRAGGGEVTKPARYKWDEAQIDALRKTKAKDCSNEEFVVFLEVAARYDLDPFAGQIYAASMGKGKGTAIIVSRDGLLSVAHRQPSFRGMVGDVVRERDEFESSFKDGKRTISHTYETNPKGEKTSDHPRGKIIGAWAMVYREGHEPTYFFAEWAEYNTGKMTWLAKPSAMILKVPESMSLRKAFSISGVVGEDEVAKEMANLSSVPEEPDWGGDPVLSSRLQAAVEAAREAVPGSFRPPKVKALLEGADHERRQEVLSEIEDFVLQAKSGEPEPAAA